MLIGLTNIPPSSTFAHTCTVADHGMTVLFFVARTQLSQKSILPNYHRIHLKPPLVLDQKPPPHQQLKTLQPHRHHLHRHQLITELLIFMNIKGTLIFEPFSYHNRWRTKDRITKSNSYEEPVTTSLTVPARWTLLTSNRKLFISISTIHCVKPNLIATIITVTS